MDRIVTFLLLLVSAVLLVPGCIAEEQVAPEVLPEGAVLEEVVEEAVAAQLPGEEVVEEVTEEITEEIFAYNVTADVNTTDINMTVGQVVMIELPETTDFEWNVTASEGLTIVNDTHIDAVEGTVGAFHQWFVEAAAAGEQAFSGVEQKADSEETGSEYTLNILVE
ncbi:protease inhibitor I42 family protein [Methanospirillum sp. J.3.6.1-F.2.7.3]|jgi:inhibitor of cysteine peptidase|uniref:Protease inhibitor I42 family protein n=2 Tax=Methanospirillum TaxID=2202 RepID=A0A8E7EI62_9EURY|nr:MULTISPECIES: protease inhibitor I42 family protein [Methanospirillum]MDX8550618.1 protease inhibitor I42 family protein [Methanospirillum hungatei]NLW77602.1 protease inhibitor I42 family protein [Methanomicrobiales archaeon]QVV89772.1 protease inhibitor I42 family protein [Methanospirillum sp. J.3.6.1-F.2.7.3]QXO95966.1 protease inhibitor I42 family protein [Methanospirillum hungatei]